MLLKINKLGLYFFFHIKINFLKSIGKDSKKISCHLLFLTIFVPV